MKKLKQEVETLIVPLLKRTEALYVQDSYQDQLENAFNLLRKRYATATEGARLFSAQFVGKVNEANKRRTIKIMERATGVDIRQLIQSEDLSDVVGAKIAENASLIRTIPEEFLKRVEGVVYRGTIRGDTAGSLIKELQKTYDITENRARVIARDQTSKINSALNKKRQQRLGIDLYVWRGAGDERQRKSHDVLNGMTCRWDDPTVYSEDDGKTWKKRSSIGGYIGDPGEDIQCRCHGQPIIRT